MLQNLQTELDKEINKELDIHLPLRGLEKYEVNLPPEQWEKLKSYIRKKTHEELRKMTTANIKKSFQIERQAGNLAFFETLKSGTLRDRLKAYEEKQKELATDLHKKTNIEEKKES